MSYGYEDPAELARKVRRLDSRAGSLDSNLTELQSEFETLKYEVEDLPGQVTRLEGDLREVRDETREKLEELESEVEGTDGQVERLLSRIEALERHIRQASGATVTDLDADPGGELLALTRTVEAGHAARAGLLSDYERNRLQMDINSHKTALAAHKKQRSDVITAAHLLTQTQADDPQRKRAEHDLVAAAQARGSGSRLRTLADAADTARQQLTADDKLRTSRAKKINTGTRADTTLRTKLRTRLTAAMDGAELLPLWFIKVMGPLPPARRAEAWLDAATDLLAYRTTYSISDPVSALGPAPAAGTRRGTWHRDLTRDLRYWT
jgi:chromosome segregation ATPase